MHVENDLVEFGTVDDQGYEEIVEEYEEIFVPEKFQEPPVTDTTDPTHAQGKPRCITRIFDNHYIYIYVVHLRYKNFMIPTCIHVSTYESY
jgi:hypothetical protein